MPRLQNSVKESFIERFLVDVLILDSFYFTQVITKDFLNSRSYFESSTTTIIFDLNDLTDNDFEKLVTAVRLFHDISVDVVVLRYVISWFRKKISITLTDDFIIKVSETSLLYD